MVLFYVCVWVISSPLEVNGITQQGIIIVEAGEKNIYPYYYTARIKQTNIWQRYPKIMRLKGIRYMVACEWIPVVPYYFGEAF